MKKVITILSAATLFSCSGQTNQNNTMKFLFKKKSIIDAVMQQDEEFLSKNLSSNKETYNVFKDYSPVKQFDVKTFNAKNLYGTYRFTDEDGMEVEQTVDEEFPSGKVKGYYEYRRFPLSAYRFYSEYNANGSLIQTVTVFFGIECGFAISYNTSGKIIKKENLDVPFKFSIENLIAKMKDEYDLDVVDISICADIDRGVYRKYKNKPLYGVYLHGIPPTGQLFCYVIDGDTGETLYSTTRFVFDNKLSLVDEYFHSLKQ
jgi:hypothetical protein